MSVAVDVQYASRGVDLLPAQADVARWVDAACASAAGEHEMTVRIVDEAEGARLNQTYRGGEGPTNVLAFPFDPPASLRLPLLGDVVVCAPVVAREAREQGKAPAAHWAHLVVHGTLHLLGFDHQHPREARVMEEKEIEILAGLGFPNPYRIHALELAAPEGEAS